MGGCLMQQHRHDALRVTVGAVSRDCTAAVVQIWWTTAARRCIGCRCLLCDLPTAKPWHLVGAHAVLSSAVCLARAALPSPVLGQLAGPDRSVTRGCGSHGRRAQAKLRRSGAHVTVWSICDGPEHIQRAVVAWHCRSGIQLLLVDSHAWLVSTLSSCCSRDDCLQAVVCCSCVGYGCCSIWGW